MRVLDPDFVSSYEIDDYVYFFFRETAIEYINCGKVRLQCSAQTAHVVYTWRCRWRAQYWISGIYTVGIFGIRRGHVDIQQSVVARWWLFWGERKFGNYNRQIMRWVVADVFQCLEFKDIWKNDSAINIAIVAIITAKLIRWIRVHFYSSKYTLSEKLSLRHSVCQYSDSICQLLKQFFPKSPFTKSPPIALTGTLNFLSLYFLIQRSCV